MWVITGPFDGKENGVVNFTKRKLLKCGRTYPLGRRARHPLQLVVNHQKVSGEHFSFTVGEHSTADVTDPDARPTLSLFNHRNKIAYFDRADGGRVTVNPLAQAELKDGDEITLIVGTKITITWQPIYCYIPPKAPTFSFEQLANIGLKVTSVIKKEATHHLTPNLTISSSTVLSLACGTQLVRPEWFEELIKLGDGDDQTTPYEVSQSSSETTEIKSCPLEREFVLPLESRFRPAFAPTLPSELKKFQVWEPDVSRSQMLKGWRFLFLTGSFSGASTSTASPEDSEMRQIVEAAGAEYDAFDVSGGRVRLKQVVGRCVRKVQSENKEAGGGKGGKGLAVVSLGEVEKVRMRVESDGDGGKEWDEVIEVLESFELRVISKDAILRSVIDIDSSNLNSLERGTSSKQPPESSPSIPPAQPEGVTNQASTSRTTTRSTVQGATSTSSANAAPSPLTPIESVSTPENDSESRTTRKRPVRRVTGSRATTPAPESENNATLIPAPAPAPTLAESMQAPNAPIAEGNTDGTASNPPRRTLTRRRAGVRATTPLLSGIDEPSPVAASSSSLTHIAVPAAHSSSAVPDRPATTSAVDVPTRPTRLKRRLREGSVEPVTTANPLLAALEAETREAEEMNAPNAPPLKKFKALFEETDPDRVRARTAGTGGGISGMEFDSGGIESQTPYPVDGMSQFGPTQTQGALRAQQTDQAESGGRLPVLMEEDENPSQAPAQSSSGGTTTVDRDIEMANTDDGLTQADSRARARSAVPEHSATQTQRKQVAFSSRDATRAKSVQPTSTQPDADAGSSSKGPDTDAAFLKALSQRRTKGKGKATQVDDAFDRDFNNLRIARPDLDGERERALEREREEWKVLAEFGDDTDVRGNFMVVVEMDVPEKKDREGSVGLGHASSKLSSQARDWQGKPDFKKFKKKSTPRYRSAVDLVVTQENDFGVGTSYWKASNTQSQSQGQTQPPAQSQMPDTSGFAGYRATQNHLQPSQVENSSRAPSKPPSKSQNKPPSRSRTQIQAPSQSTRRGKSREVPSDESDNDEEPKTEAVARQPHVVTRKGRSGATVGGTLTTAKGKAAAKATAREKSPPLFLEPEGEEDEIEDFAADLDAVGSSEDEDKSTMRSNAPARRKAKSKPMVSGSKPPSSSTAANRKKRAVAEVLDDDVDDGMTFGGFGGRKRTRAK